MQSLQVFQRSYSIWRQQGYSSPRMAPFMVWRSRRGPPHFFCTVKACISVYYSQFLQMLLQSVFVDVTISDHFKRKKQFPSNGIDLNTNRPSTAKHLQVVFKTYKEQSNYDYFTIPYENVQFFLFFFKKKSKGQPQSVNQSNFHWGRIRKQYKSL